MENDPELEEEWYVVVPISRQGAPAEILAEYKKLVRDFVKHIPPKDRERITIDLQV